MVTREPVLRGLRRGLEAFAARASRSLSARAQTRLELSLVDLEEASLEDFAASHHPWERSAVVELETGGSPAFVLLSRTLAFSLLALRFGARPATLDAAAPERPYTRIEERGLECAAGDLWQALCAGARGDLPESVRVVGVEDSGRLRERGAERLWIARFAVSGLEQEAQLTLAIPCSLPAAARPAKHDRRAHAG